MTFSELGAEILRLYEIEKWPKGTIARTLRVHHSVVERVINRRDIEAVTTRRGSIVEDYVSFIRDILGRYPSIKASRIFIMLKERGYPGKSVGLIRMHVRRLRPPKIKEAYFRLVSLPGEQAQVDWAHFGSVSVEGTTRKLYGFVMTLSWSRQIFLRFFHSATSRDFYQGIAEAFAFFGGVPRKLWLDNLKSGVTSRVGSAIQYNERMLALAAHFRFEPVAVGVRKGNEKGKVERSIQYVRGSFFEGRAFRSLNELNDEARRWCLTTAAERRWQENPDRKVSDCFEEEKEKLIPRPERVWTNQERIIVNIPKIPFARFDLNYYSVPHEYAGKQVILDYDDESVRILSDENMIAEHLRSYGKQRYIENQAHFSGLRERKTAAKRGSGMARLYGQVPVAEEFISIMAERGENVGCIISRLLHLMDLYGPKHLSTAIEEVVIQDTPKLRSLHFVLQRLEKNDAKLLAVPQTMLEGRAAAVYVTPHSASQYDKITGIKS